MRPILFLLLSALLSPSAFAGNVNLFVVQKPENPQNLVQVVINEQACRLGDLDFHWLMDGTTYKPMNSLLKRGTASRISVVQGRADHPAACPKNLPAGTSCQAKFITMADMGLVKHGLRDPSLVVKAVKSSAGCNVSAYMELPTGVIKVKKFEANGERLSTSIFPPSTTVRVDSVKVISTENKATEWKCASNCEATIRI